jgi:hypothetical protein
MTFKTRPIKKQFGTEHDFGFKNLVVSGCSFTYNNSDQSAVAWPYYLRDLGGFEQVFDCSMPGAGNSHISNALIWGLEQEQLDPELTMVVVMWSGADRDDYVCPIENISPGYPFQFHYSDQVLSAITGGADPDSHGNTRRAFKEFADTKNPYSRAIENYLDTVKTYQYLQSKKYRSIFLNFLDPKIPSRYVTFDTRQHLPKSLVKNLDIMIDPSTDLYAHAVRQDLLDDDFFHPNPDGHLSWTRNILIPRLKHLFG